AISIDVVTVFDASITGNLDIHFRGPVNAVYSVHEIADSCQVGYGAISGIVLYGCGLLRLC
ncbi:hypothetical protein, partial [Phocaeicola sp.]|uniref:hypothetical protein n=1 Tax=Phocaeicola sp. TaxID=2773926 RepID=UPI003AB22F37